MNGARSNIVVHRVVASLALLTAPFIAAERADAACDPPTSEAAPVTNTTVNCTGTTRDQNADNVTTFVGYGTGNETAITVNVGDATTPASVTASSNVPAASGISIHDGTVNNFGTVTVESVNGTGIDGHGTLTVNNSGGINFDTTGHGDRGIHTTGNVDVTNTSTGTIFGGISGIEATGIANVTNAGRITAANPNGAAIRASTANVTNNGGTIEATGANGIAISAATNVTVTSNTGTIQANADGGKAINGADVTVTSNIGTIQATGTGGSAIFASGTATVTNSGSITGGVSGIHAAGLDVTNALGGTISGGVFGIVGSGTVRNAGTITGPTAVIFEPGFTTNTLIVQTGSVLNGLANGNPGATNNLILQGNGIVSNAFLNFNSLDVQAVGSWTWNTNANFHKTTVSSGTFVVDSSLSSVFTVKSGGTLAGQGQVFGSVTVEGGGTVAPGAAVPFSTLSSGNLTFQPGSIFRVNVNASGQNDKLQTNTATLTGGTVNVLAQNGTYAPSTRYTILTGTGTGAVSGTFSGVTSNLAFLTPSLSYDDNDVFLTLVTNGGGSGGGTGFGFATVAQTRNQKAVAGALDASPTSSPLVTALLNQTADGARQAFDALSGEVFGSVQTTQAGQTQLARSAMLGRMRQASYSGAPGELGALAFGGPELAYAADGNGFPVKTPGMGDRSRDLTFWAQGLGGWGHTDSDGNAASVSSRFGGFLSGVDARYGDMLRAGLVAGYMRSDLNAAARSSSAGIDSVQLGAYAGGRLGAFNVRGGASYSYDSIDTSRSIAFPGFTDQTQAHFHGNVGQVFGEVGYGMTFNQVAVEPLAGLAYVHLHNGAFLESGGVAALSGSSVNENIGYSSLGMRAATALPLANGTVLVPRGSLQWQHAFGDVTPAAALAFQGTGAAFSTAGVPIARDTALVESGFDWRFSPQAKLGAYYQGELAAHAQAHAFKGTFNWNF